MQDDAQDRVDRARAQRFGARDEVTGGVVDQRIERSRRPDRLDHRLDLARVTDIADVPGDPFRKLRREPGGGFFEHVLPAAADHHRRPQFQEASGHALAETGAAAGDENALAAEKIAREHCLLLPRPADLSSSRSAR